MLPNNYSSTAQLPVGSGVYVCRYPTNASLKAVIRFVKEQLGYEIQAPSHLHCTILYSVHQPTTVMYPATNTVMGQVVALDRWDGADLLGYLVLKLAGVQLQFAHNRWAHAGCPPTFSPYNPHVTIKTPCSAGEYDTDQLRKANEVLRNQKLELHFTHEFLYQNEDVV